MTPEDEWRFVAVEARSGDLKEQVAKMLLASGLQDIAKEDIRIDTICTRGSGEDSVRVWIRSRPEPGRPAP